MPYGHARRKRVNDYVMTDLIIFYPFFQWLTGLVSFQASVAKMVYRQHVTATDSRPSSPQPNDISPSHAAVSSAPALASPPLPPSPPPLSSSVPTPSSRAGRKQVLIPRISPTGSCSSFLSQASKQASAAPPRTPTKNCLAQ